MDEDIAIPAIVFSFILAFAWMVLGYFKSKHKLGPSGESSLRTSELKVLMREAVEEANAPLVARIEALEDRLDTPALPPRIEREPQTTR